MPETFCYLLGAGASCKVLPVSENFPEKMEEFLSFYNEFRAEHDRQNPSDPNISANFLKYESDFKDSMNWLMTEAKNHTSIDTFAKMLHLTNDYNGLARLKATLATYLVMAQAKYGTDLRYDGFLATILHPGPPMGIGLPLIPDNIRIVTWNYDIQLEKGFYQYLQNKEEKARKFTIYHNITKNRHIKRINGLAWVPTLNYPKSHEYAEAALRPFSIDTVFIALERYFNFKANTAAFHLDIQFAWELMSDLELFKGTVAPAIKDTTILIDIGYSFPFFNREIDRILLNCMSNLKKIYIQVKKPDHDAIKERLQSIAGNLSKVEFKDIYDEKRFHIPYEL
jgi:hypothetical protein